MNDEHIRARVLAELRKVAPEVDPDALDPVASFRDQYEIDSVDFLKLMLALEKRLGVEIPDLDYPKLSSLDGSVAYLRARSSGKGAAKPGAERAKQPRKKAAAKRPPSKRAGSKRPSSKRPSSKRPGPKRPTAKDDG